MSAQTVLITGASSGIGRELAVCFARDGSNLVLTARRLDRLEEHSRRLTESFGISCTVIPADLGAPEGAQQLFDECRRRGLEIDVLVNNAGFGLNDAFLAADLERQLRMIQVNVVSLVKLSHLFLAEMTARGRGGVLNVASTAAFQPGPFMAVYYATKAFVLSFSEALAAELSRSSVKVCCFAPGPVETEFMETAGLRRRGALRLMSIMSAERAARLAYRGFRRGKVLTVPGLLNRFGVFAVRLMPRSVIRRLILSINQVSA